MSNPPASLRPSPVQSRRTWRWVLLALVVIIAVAAVSTYLTAPRPGGRMDAESTSPDGGHALVTLLRERGVDVVVAEKSPTSNAPPAQTRWCSSPKATSS